MKLYSERVVVLLFAGMLASVLAVGCKVGPHPSTPSPMPQSAPTVQPPNRSPEGILDPDKVPVSQSPLKLRFERIGIEDGLSNSAVWKILQDSEGFMWFGTQDGLNREESVLYDVDGDN